MNNEEYSSIDELTKALKSSSVNILCSTPMRGKTSLAINIMLNAVLKNKAKVAVFSLEMDKVWFTNRAICSVARISLSHACRGEITQNEWTRLLDANTKLQNTNIYVDDTSPITPEEIIQKCMRLKQEHGLDLVMIDYLGLIVSQNHIEETNAVLKELDALAKKIECPILLLFQLSPQSRGIPVSNTISKYNHFNGQWLLLRSYYPSIAAVEYDAAVKNADVFFLQGDNAGKIISFEFEPDTCKFYTPGKYEEYNNQSLGTQLNQKEATLLRQKMEKGFNCFRHLS